MDAFERHFDHLTEATKGLDDLITVGAYSLSRRPEFGIRLEADYFVEKDLSAEELRLRRAVRAALSSLSFR